MTPAERDAIFYQICPTFKKYPPSTGVEHAIYKEIRAFVERLGPLGEAVRSSDVTPAEIDVLAGTEVKP